MGSNANNLSGAASIEWGRSKISWLGEIYAQKHCSIYSCGGVCFYFLLGFRPGNKTVTDDIPFGFVERAENHQHQSRGGGISRPSRGAAAEAGRSRRGGQANR